MNSLKNILVFALLTVVFSAGQTNQQLDEKKIKSNYETIKKFSPNFRELNTIDTFVEKQDYQTIKNIIAEVKSEYLRRVMVYIDVASNELKEKYYRHVDQAVFKTDLDLFPIASSMLAFNNHLIMGAHKLYRARKAFDKLFEAYISGRAELEVLLNAYDIDKNDFNETYLSLLKNNAIFHMFKGDQGNVRYAINNLELLLEVETKGDVTVPSTELASVYKYLCGCYHLIYKDRKANAGMAKKALQKELFYLWKLAVLLNKDQPKLLEVKLMDLIDKYYWIIDTTNYPYKEMYKKYYDKLARTKYKSIEKKARQNIEEEKAYKEKDKERKPAETREEKKEN
ncbi:MAG TPA: hypothetical protein VKS21_08260 [Spirochaetota bacterium]|nr:hypothetical protein [Spirochaetota bacterium]